MSVPADRFIRQATGEIGPTGNSTFEWNLTAPYMSEHVKLIVQEKILPVLFVPGIMGSNLKSLSGKPVWRLDDGVFGAPTKLVKKMIFKGAGERQLLMHPKRTKVDPSGKVPNRAVGSITGKDKASREAVFRKQRFWGEIGSGSYHEYLLWLEETLNGKGVLPQMWPSFGYKHSMMSAAPVAGQPHPIPALLKGQPMVVLGMPSGCNEKALVDLTSDDLLKRATMRMPVYACGYNWLESNGDAAKFLRNRIRHIISEESKRGICNQVLLVTHSMGGLLARRCAQLSGMADAIAGIVHGVMPATGAAVAYRRCKIGMWDEDKGAALVIGKNGRETTSVFAQAPGALQLLPTSQYKSGWLKIISDKNVEALSAPAANPYSEIYLRSDRWWALIRDEWLRPSGGLAISWEDYKYNIGSAQSFHESIRGFYHPNTYVYYGADKNWPSYETVRWKMKKGVLPDKSTPPTSDGVRDMEFGAVRDDGTIPLYVGGSSVFIPNYSGGPPAHHQTSYWQLVAEKQDGAGDGTVPSSSGQSPLRHARIPGSIRQQYRLTGFEHEPSYRNAGAQLVTLHCIHKIAADANFVS